MRPIALRLACACSTEYIQQQLCAGNAPSAFCAAIGTRDLRGLPVAPDQAPSAPEAPCRVQYSVPWPRLEAAPYRYFISVDRIRLRILCMMECIQAGSLRAFWLAERTIRCSQKLLFFAASASRSRARCSAPTGGTDPDSTARRGRAAHSTARRGVTAWTEMDNECSRLHYVSRYIYQDWLLASINRF